MNLRPSKTVLFLIPALLLSCVACKPRGQSSDTPTQTNTAGETVSADRQLSQFQSIAGTPFQFAPIVDHTEKRSLLSAPSKSYDSGWQPVYNYLFLNTDTAEFTKLLDTNRNLIAATEQFPTGPKTCNSVGECRPEPKKVKSIVYTLIKADTNNDQSLTTADLQTIAVSDASGQNYTEVVQNAEVIYHKVYKPATERLLVVYRRDGKRFVDVIDLVKKRPITTKQLPDLGADVK